MSKEYKVFDSTFEEDQSRFLNSKEVDELMPLQTFNKTFGAGFVVSSEINDGQYEYRVINEGHALVVGVTGSGKTTKFMIPTIIHNVNCSEKPWMIVTDIKGELFAKTSAYAKENGYKVITIDLRESKYSTKWNPLKSIWDYHSEFLKTEDPFYYEKAEDGISNFIEAIFPINKNVSANTRFFTSSARNVMFTILLSWLEDSKYGFIKEKEFNLNNFSKWFSSSKYMFQDYFNNKREYYEDRNLEVPKSVFLASKLVNQTYGDGMGGVMNTIKSILDKYMRFSTINVTTEHEIEYDINKPTIFYLIFPPENPSSHFLASIFISEMYQTLVTLANKKYDGRLPKKVMFIMDEFANFPIINEMDSKVSVARSLNIQFAMIIQSLTQMKSKYGNLSDSIIDNVHTLLYLRTNDLNTSRMFESLLGSNSMGKPLMNESAIRRIDKHSNLLLLSGQFPLKAKYYPLYESIWWKENLANKKKLVRKKSKPLISSEWDKKYNLSIKKVSDSYALNLLNKKDKKAAKEKELTWDKLVENMEKKEAIKKKNKLKSTPPKKSQTINDRIKLIDEKLNNGFEKMELLNTKYKTSDVYKNKKH